MIVLITGAAGFIGSNFVDHVLKNTNAIVYGLDCLNYAGDLNNLQNQIHNSNRFTFIHGNIDDSEILNSIDFDHVVNFAAETHVTRSINDGRSFIINDMLATDTLLRSSVNNKKLKKFIHISTSEVYGTCENEAKKINENHPLNPLSPYAAAKVGGDRLVYSYGKTYNLPFVILRPFNNYGPRQHLEKVIPRFITTMINNGKLTIHGKGQSKRDFIHVDDTCSAILKVLLSKKKIIGETYNIGSGYNFSVAQIASLLCKLEKYSKKKIKLITNRPGQVDKHWCDYRKFQKTFSWKPTIKFQEGLVSTVKWYKENKKWWEKKIISQKVRVVMPNGKIFFH
jgi:dTDP-glucose 4,6-dehydratase